MEVEKCAEFLIKLAEENPINFTLIEGHVGLHSMERDCLEAAFVEKAHDHGLSSSLINCIVERIQNAPLKPR